MIPTVTAVSDGKIALFFPQIRPCWDRIRAVVLRSIVRRQIYELCAAVEFTHAPALLVIHTHTVEHRDPGI